MRILTASTLKLFLALLIGLPLSGQAATFVYSYNAQNIEAVRDQVFLERAQLMATVDPDEFITFMEEQFSNNGAATCSAPLPYIVIQPSGYHVHWAPISGAVKYKLGRYDLFSNQASGSFLLQPFINLGFGISFQAYTLQTVCILGQSNVQLIIVDKDFFRGDDGNPTLTAPPAPVYDLAISPNPFRQQFTLRYQLREAANVQVVISDLNGKAVLPVRRKNRQPKGVYQEQFDLQNLPAGIYICSFLGSEQTHRKIVKTE